MCKLMTVDCKNCHHQPVKVLATFFLACLLFESCFGGIMWWVGREQGRTERAWVSGTRAQVATKAIAEEEKRLRKSKDNEYMEEK